MKHAVIRVALALSLLAVSSIATAKPCKVESPPEPKRTRAGVGLYFEQDSVLPWLGRWGGDQNYTMGVAIPVLTGQWIHDKKLDTLLRGMDCLTGMVKVHNKQVLESAEDAFQDFAMVLGYTAFTPRNLSVSIPIHDDRPYASLLFISSGRLSANPYTRRAWRSELTVGVLGLRIGESVQTWIHTKRRKNNGPGALTPYDPEGWPLQVSDGGEPTAKYTIGLTRATSESEFHDLAISGEGSVGYYTNVALGGTLRVGRLRSPFWAHNSNPLSAANQVLRRESGEMPDGADVDKTRASKSFELAAFGSGRLRVVGYNALLQGQFKDSPVTFNSGQVSRAVLEAEAGVSIGWKRCSGVVTVARRSAEFMVGQTRAHTFGGVHVVCGGGSRGPGQRN